MKIERLEGSQERRILTGMIVDKGVLSRIAPRWSRLGLFRSPWANLVAGWCVDFFHRYGKPPAAAIEHLYEDWASGKADPDTAKLVGMFLGELSGEYVRKAETINTEHLLDLAGKHFNEVRIRRIKDELETDLDVGELDKAQKRLTEFSRVELGVGSGIKILQDQSVIQQAFASKSEPLITYPDALGVFFGNALERDGFVAMEGPEKRGKSRWMLDMAWRAMLQKRRVAFFEVGDMSQHQVMRRLMVRACGRPFEKGTVRYPTFIEPSENERVAADVTYEEKTFKAGLTAEQAWKKCQEIAQDKLGGLDDLFRLSCHPNSSINILGIQSILQDWEREGFEPDCVFVDYADILLPIDGKADTREQINMTWKRLRGLSQSLHCLVVTASQTDAASYGVHTLTTANFTEDKRKRAHTTGTFGLNQTEEEKEAGITRLNWLVGRDWEYSQKKCVHVAGCPAIGNPAIRSAF